jgi:hypothetical protein
MNGRTDSNSTSPVLGKYSPLSYFNPAAQRLLVQQIAVRTALFGDGRQTHTRHLVARHEAGHLVAFQLCGLRPKEGKIWRNTATGLWFGHSIHSGHAYERFLAPERPHLVVALAFEWLAGSAAEALYGGIADPGSSADEAVAAEFALDGAAHGLDIPSDQLRLTLIAFLEFQMEIYRAVGEKIADELERRRVVKGKILRRLLKPVPPLGREAIGRCIAEGAANDKIVARLAAAFADAGCGA